MKWSILLFLRFMPSFWHYRLHPRLYNKIICRPWQERGFLKFYDLPKRKILGLPPPPLPAKFCLILPLSQWLFHLGCNLCKLFYLSKFSIFSQHMSLKHVPMPASNQNPAEGSPCSHCIRLWMKIVTNALHVYSGRRQSSEKHAEIENSQSPEKGVKVLKIMVCGVKVPKKEFAGIERFTHIQPNFEPQPFPFHSLWSGWIS